MQLPRSRVYYRKVRQPGQGLRMLGIPLRVDDRADHSFDAPVIIGAAIYLEVFDIG